MAEDETPYTGMQGQQDPRRPALVIARGDAAGRLAGAAALAGSGEVLVVPTAAASMPRLSRAAVPPSFVLADVQALGAGFVAFLRTLADPDLSTMLLVSGAGEGVDRAVAVARRLGLSAAALGPRAGALSVRAALARLRAEPPPAPPELTADALREAIASGAIVNRYQPQVRLSDAKPMALEALARWEHPVHGLLGANAFIPLAEASHQAGDLATRVVRRAVADLSAMHRLGHRFSMAFNLPLDMLLDPVVIDRLAEAIEEGGLPADAVTIELTESQVAHDIAAVRAAATRLRDRRFGVSIDDFSMSAAQSRLVALPFSEMKIDRSLLEAAERDRTARDSLAAVVRMAHGLGLVIVVEGVASLRAWQIARDMGADLAQGWIVGRPLPAGAIAGWADAWNASIATGPPGQPARAPFGG